MKSAESDWSLSSIEEAFFRESDRIEAEQTLDDLEAEYERPSLWQRLTGKKR